MIDQKFSKKLRLLSNKDFNFVFKKPYLVSNLNIIIYGRLNMLKYPRVGLSISKKNIKLSCERNRIKRLLRESFRLNKHLLPTMDYVIVIKKNIININNMISMELLNKLWRIYYYYPQG